MDNFIMKYNCVCVYVCTMSNWYYIKSGIVCEMGVMPEMLVLKLLTI